MSLRVMVVMKKVYTFVMRIFLYIGKFLLQGLYFFLKLFPIQKKVVMLSRQSNKPSLDFELIQKEIKKRDKDIKIEILCKTLKKSFKERIKYCFYIFKCMYHLATSRVCITDGYSIPISLLKHKKKLEVIQIWHASGAIKKFGYQSLGKKEGRGKKVAKIMNMHKHYSHVVAPSKKTAKFYMEAFGVKEKNIIINRLPRVDYIMEPLKKEILEKFYKDYPIYKDKSKKIILYIPTYRKNFDSSAVVKRIVDNIDFNNFLFMLRLHPLDKNNGTKQYCIKKKYSTYDLLKIADYIITDYSAVAFEASLLLKPLYFYVYDIEKYQQSRGLNIDLLKEMRFCTSKDIRIILNQIKVNQYNFKKLEKWKKDYMGKYEYGKDTKKLVDFIFEYLDGKVKNEEKNIKHIKKEYMVKENS